MALFGFKKEEKKEHVSDEKADAKILYSSKDIGYSLKKPLVTEKAIALEGGRQYIFKVGADSSKPQIKKDVEGLYGVKVESVNIINIKRKSKFMRGKIGYSAGFKKAVVKLKEGYKIEIAPR